MDCAKIPQADTMYIPMDSESQECEQFWVSHQPFLASCGYMLRPRYHPDWIPSWKSNPHPISLLQFYEDEHVIHEGRAWRLIDATRISDGCKVVLKVVSLLANEYELRLTHFLSQPAVRRDPRNHAIPVLDVVNLPDRDISINNVVMDQRRIMPKRYHFGFDASQDGIEWNPPTELRCLAGPVDYYYIDLQFAEYFPEGRDKAIISEIADIYQLGATMLDEFGATSRHSGLSDFKPLLRNMVSVNPDE
ncbi:uncharacterized protein BT62DRAFT_1080180 [Guyanagaster necrorhizus]|uniref:Uncharacterized protein n=1 Tax=Guyanagaster necrorhizus TaxID=856835 RepID=A0A9P8AN22_9AGAR|nr:uncharacterized protein BT62DRAFT_1080180 [Guyanagaster necrorhizus MCA 3950]KAG7441306.1 hypothetical protein BT62DRAFT_1080180 [Guyanagaster necrorhizus MCA 3950]